MRISCKVRDAWEVLSAKTVGRQVGSLRKFVAMSDITILPRMDSRLKTKNGYFQVRHFLLEDQKRVTYQSQHLFYSVLFEMVEKKKAN